ncbi:DUF202 domain-containing protein [Microbacterium sp. ARD31]|jgi:uncharacterized membrane protein YidH (DUF202 family)|uniref:DUF202 domain-containing protein n=1 Tax=Microbacterium sp. ARD31 TaxID=2962576 RepID=UPI00288113A7|nr:DUF202 domain-containing protein [Microbacterium sp. ARD31]MDT0180611.1 DUF202 domain-containing protein [Microbacterium sp. ARD31]
MSGLFDPGLQPERTELAWRRTALALAVGSLVALRLLPAVLGHVAWIAPGIAGLVASGVLWLAARRRYAGVSAATSAGGDRVPLPDGRLPLALAVVATGAAAVGVVVVAAVALG